ncbi:HAD family hydrolase [Saccharopolyspora rectivirgula]|nr:HAD family hydrolase [Saccharopolyspora rectivirgula]
MEATEDPMHIVWDWNGTLFDDNHAVLSAVNAVCAEFGRAHIDLETWRSIYSRPLWTCYERLLGQSLSEQDWARIDQRYHEVYRELLHTCDLADGVPEVLEKWAADGRSQSLLSLWFHDELVPLVTDFGIHRLFTRVDGLREKVGGGSKAEHLKRHLQAQQLDPATVVLVGDVLDDAHAAQQVGARCVLVTTGVTGRRELEKTGFPVADSIVEAVGLVGAGLS